jgi:hypothetical protein
MKDSELENITSEKNKPLMLYVGLDALSLDNGDEPKVGHDEVSDAVTRARRKGGKAYDLYKPETVERLLRSVRSGLTLKQAAVAAGISESTLQSWKHKHPELIPQLEEARERAREDALRTIWEAREDDWRAAESFLKYSFWQDYRSGAQVSVNQNTAVVVEKTMTEEERMKLIAQRERTQRQLDAPQDKPAVIEATIVATDQPEQAQEQPEPKQEGFYQKPPNWDEKHEESKKEAALFATKEDEQAERDRQLLRNKLEISQLFGSDD